MLSKKLRFSGKKNISEFFRKSAVFVFGGISLRFEKNASKKTFLGVFVGMKYSKKAVERNRIRRKIWAVLDGKYSRLKKGFNIAIIPSRNINKKIDSGDLDKLIEASLKKSGLIEK